MRLITVTPASGNPVTLAELKQHINVTTSSTAENDRLTELLNAATSFCQRDISGNRQLMSATYDYKLSGFPNGRKLWLPLPPLSSVTSVTYLDTSDASQTFSSSNYVVNRSDHNQGFIERKYSVSWPATSDRADAVTVRFVAGYASASAVPSEFKHAIKLIAGHWNENREALIVGTISSEVAIGVQRLLSHWGYGHYG